MPHVRFNGDRFLVSFDARTVTSGYFVDLAANFNDFRKNGTFTDINIRCKDGSVATHKVLVASKSKLLSRFFRDNPSTSDILCPDFSIENVGQLLDLLYSGEAVVCESDLHEIAAVIESLDFSVALSESSVMQPESGAQEGMADVVPRGPSSDQVDFSDESLDNVETSVKPPQVNVEVESILTSKIKTLECSECHKTFGMRFALNKHRQRFHQASTRTSSHEPMESDSTSHPETGVSKELADSVVSKSKTPTRGNNFRCACFFPK